ADSWYYSSTLSNCGSCESGVGFVVIKMNRKLKKLIKNPGVFFRDYLNKKYPQINCEQKFLESEEGSVYNTEKKLWEIESLINSPEHKEVDAVFTWVNDKDPKWLEKKDYYINKSNPLGCKFSVDVARFENHNELF